MRETDSKNSQVVLQSPIFPPFLCQFLLWEENVKEQESIRNTYSEPLKVLLNKVLEPTSLSSIFTSRQQELWPGLMRPESHATLEANKISPKPR